MLAYLWIAGRLAPLGLAGAPAVGASLPSLALAAVAYLLIAPPLGHGVGPGERRVTGPAGRRGVALGNRAIQPHEVCA